MVLMAKLPRKRPPVASVYRPTAQVHAANDTLMVRGYKHMTGISRHAHMDALSGPREHGCEGFARSSNSWQTVVAREWVRQGAWAKEDFRESQAYTLETHQTLRGGCPAVLTLGPMEAPCRFLTRHVWLMWELRCIASCVVAVQMVLRYHHTIYNAKSAIFMCIVNVPQMVFLPFVLHLTFSLGLVPKAR